jgi:hypothetical protein
LYYWNLRLVRGKMIVMKRANRRAVDLCVWVAVVAPKVLMALRTAVCDEPSYGEEDNVWFFRKRKSKLIWEGWKAGNWKRDDGLSASSYFPTT